MIDWIRRTRVSIVGGSDEAPTRICGEEGKRAPQGAASAMDERERQLQADYEWGLRDPRIRDAYAGQVVAIWNKQVWGAGSSHLVAWHAASRAAQCPPRERTAFVVVPAIVATEI